MNRVLGILGLTLAFVSNSAWASEFAVFYENAVSEHWSVRGVVLKEQALAPTCTAEAKWSDGSYVHLSKDIDENLIYLWVRNPRWEIDRKEVRVRLDFYSGTNSTGYFTKSALFSALCPRTAPLDW